MKTRVSAVFAVLLSVPLLGLAQNQPRVVAKIPFSFVAEGKTLPSGSYEFQLMGNGLSDVLITDTHNDHAIMVPIIAPDGNRAISQAKVVFDEVGNTCILSKVVIPDMGGYVTFEPAGAAPHTIVTVMK
jgi:hypothetical protein